MTYSSVVLNPGSGGESIATDNVGGKHLQIVKISLAPENSDSLIADGNPLPIKFRVDGADVGAANPLPISITNPAAIDHGSIGGLADDDHLQYLNETRHDALPSDNPHSVTITQAIAADAVGFTVANLTTLTDGSNANALHVHTLQNVFDASTSPEIVVDATRGALTVQDNATPIGANLFEVETNGGVDLFSVDVSEAIFGVDARPDASARSLGIEANKWNRVFGHIGVLLNQDGGSGTETINFPIFANAGGLLGGTQSGAGTKVHTLSGNALLGAVACIGNCTNYFGGVANCTVEATNSSSIAMGSCYSYGYDTHMLTSSGFASFATGYSYGVGPTDITSSGAASFAMGYANASAAGSDCRIQATGDGSFAGGICAGSGTSIGRIRATNLGAFAFGRISQTDVNTADIEATSQGSLAFGSAQSGAGGLGLIRASGQGSMAIGSAFQTTISATQPNSFQFGPGTNTLSDSVQIGNAGFRIKGTVGAPGVLQDGDMWIDTSIVNIRSNGTTVLLDQPSVTGSRGGNAALASLLTQLAASGIITDNTVP